MFDSHKTRESKKFLEGKNKIVELACDIKKPNHFQLDHHLNLYSFSGEINWTNLR